MLNLKAEVSRQTLALKPSICSLPVPPVADAVSLTVLGFAAEREREREVVCTSPSTLSLPSPNTWTHSAHNCQREGAETYLRADSTGLTNNRQTSWKPATWNIISQYFSEPLPTFKRLQMQETMIWFDNAVLASFVFCVSHIVLYFGIILSKAHKSSCSPQGAWVRISVFVCVQQTDRTQCFSIHSNYIPQTDLMLWFFLCVRAKVVFSPPKVPYRIIQ